MTGNFLDILILFGSIQGFISAFLLFRKKRLVKNYLLAIILLITSLACLNIYLFNVLPDEIPVILDMIEKVVPLIIIMPLGPLIYFYTKSSFGVPFHFKKERVHFISTLLDFVPAIVSLTAIILYFFGAPSYAPSNYVSFNDGYQKYVDIPRWFSTSIYLFLAIRFYQKSKIKVNKSVWIKQLLIGFALFQFLWLIHLIPYISNSSWLLETVSWYPIYLPMTILVYWLGVTGVIQSKSDASSILLDQEGLKETIELLNNIMLSERLFLNPTLSLTEVVKRTEINQKKISAALNQYLGKSFNEYVNEFRIGEVKSKLIDPEYDHLSITGIAFESGFNSQATFQRSFKSVVKMTPRAFQVSLKNETKASHS